jgi:hypothetical protein
MSATKKALPLLVLLLLNGCAAKQTYSGERLPPEQVAKIQRNTIKTHLYYTRTLNVASVDGMQPSAMQTDFEVLPGQHTLSLRVLWQTKLLAAPVVASQGWQVNTTSLTFQAEAGRRYKLNGEEGPNNIYFVWLEDADTGAIVAGTRPGTAQP